MLLADPPTILTYGAAEISAGSFAVNRSHLAVGTYSGWALFDLETLLCLRSEPRFLPEHCAINGVQFDGDDVLLVGFRRAQSFDKPANWHGGIWSASPGGDPCLVADLGPGNWRLVRRRVGGQVVVYDVTEDQGVHSYSRSGATWGVAIPHIRVAIPSDTGILCLCQDRVVSLDLDGAIVGERKLPRPERYVWTAVGCLPSSRLTLGGFNRDSHAFAVAIAPDEHDRKLDVFEHPLDRVFSGDAISRAFEDECCGVDIFHIGRIEPQGPHTLMLTLGGGGEGLGACQGAGAVAVLRANPGGATWETQVLDEDEGISGLLQLPNGRLLVDFCGEIRRYEPAPSGA